jgi:hypothetical protein
MLRWSQALFPASTFSQFTAHHPHIRLLARSLESVAEQTTRPLWPLAGLCHILSTVNWVRVTDILMLTTTVLRSSLHPYYPPWLLTTKYVSPLLRGHALRTSPVPQLHHCFLYDQEKLTPDKTYLALVSRTPPRMSCARPEMAADVPAVSRSFIVTDTTLPSSSNESLCRILQYTDGGSFNCVSNLSAFQLQDMRRSSKNILRSVC